mmetsp:Transcript_14618/g.44074  ORF Transcript_14618/g.44074 Transcript_14618/m.44074 type:complete len:282 (+) Transcript_14618:348-1193(+)
MHGTAPWVASPHARAKHAAATAVPVAHQHAAAQGHAAGIVRGGTTCAAMATLCIPDATKHCRRWVSHIVQVPTGKNCALDIGGTAQEGVRRAVVDAVLPDEVRDIKLEPAAAAPVPVHRTQSRSRWSHHAATYVAPPGVTAPRASAGHTAAIAVAPAIHLAAQHTAPHASARRAMAPETAVRCAAVVAGTTARLTEASLRITDAAEDGGRWVPGISEVPTSKNGALNVRAATQKCIGCTLIQVPLGCEFLDIMRKIVGAPQLAGGCPMAVLCRSAIDHTAT